jgi:hypothetical protein
MNDLASAISASVKLLGQAFLVAYYLPATAVMLVHFYLLIPVWTGAPVTFPAAMGRFALPLIGEVDLSPLIGALLLSLIVGIVLVGLNNLLIKMFEGKVGWLRRGLLSPLTRSNRRRCEKLYGCLAGLQKEYRRVSNLFVQTQSAEERERIRQQLAGLARQIQKEHKEVEEKHPHQTLPHDVDRVAPTSFGNAYAIAEEYAYERYGIDAVLFWLRLRELMQDSAPSHSERITGQKTMLDLLLNLALVSGLLVAEAVLTLLFGFGGHSSSLIPLALISAVLFVGFYGAAVGAVRTMGELIKISFDYHRHLVLEAFNLQPPDDLIAEQAIWVRLAAFVRRGDEFYFPAEAHR